jgi:hypothetical protein
MPGLIIKEELIVKRLVDVDKELHSIIEELSINRHNKSLSLSELNKLMEKDRILDIDSTELIREMRDRAYDL